MILINNGITEKLFDNVSSGIKNSSDFALPALATQISWQTLFGSAPASITIQILESLDGVTFAVVDTSTSTAGELKTFNSSALFVRARINAISGGSGITVELTAKAGLIGVITPASVTDGSLVLFNGTGGNKFKELLFPGGTASYLRADGTFAIPGEADDPFTYIEVGTAPFASSGSIRFGNASIIKFRDSGDSFNFSVLGIQQAIGGFGEAVALGDLAQTPTIIRSATEIDFMYGGVQLNSYIGSPDGTGYVELFEAKIALTDAIPYVAILPASTSLETPIGFSFGPNDYGVHTGVILVGSGLHPTGNDQTWLGDHTNPLFLVSAGTKIYNGDTDTLAVANFSLDAIFAATVTAAAFISNSANPASNGAIRLAYTDQIYFRNADDTDDILIISLNGYGPNDIVIGGLALDPVLGNGIFSGSVTATDFIMSGSRLKSDTTNAHAGGIAVYDVNGAAYRDFLVWTNGDAPAVVMSIPTTGTLDITATTVKAALATSANATTGLVAGVLSALTNASIVIKDGSGQAYRVPVII